MKTISLAAAQADLNSLVTESQSDRVVIERNGRPSAVVVGIEDDDEEDRADRRGWSKKDVSSLRSTSK